MGAIRKVVTWLLATWRWLTATHRRRRNLALTITLLTSPAWAVLSAPAVVPPSTDDGLGPPGLAPPEVMAAITAGRPEGYPVGGIDISSHDHRNFGVHWRTELAVDTEFVYIKATEGTTYVNPHFAADYATAKKAHRYVGAYVFARPDRGDPVGQAEHFLRNARYTRDDRTLVPFVDLEWPYTGNMDRCYGLKPEQMRAWITAFIGRIERGIGRKPMIYTNTYWWNPCTGSDPSFGDYPLDIANYTKRAPVLPAGWSKFALWQYTAGNPERRYDHDRDVVSGGLAGLAALAWTRSR